MFFSIILPLVSCRRKKELKTEDPEDEPIREAPEFGKVYYPNNKRWGHYVGRVPNALVAFVENDAAGSSVVAAMMQVNEMIDKSKLNIVIAQTFMIPQIIEDQGVTEFPSIRFYRSGQKRWSDIYEGFPSAKSITRWAMEKVNELDEWENMED